MASWSSLPQPSKFASNACVAERDEFMTEKVSHKTEAGAENMRCELSVDEGKA